MKLANPFLTAGYAGPEYFCDRKREAEELIRHLDNDRNTTLISPRRYGKTGLIRRFEDQESIRHQLEEDLKRLEVLCDEPARKILREMEEKLQKLKG